MSRALVTRLVPIAVAATVLVAAAPAAAQAPASATPAFDCAKAQGQVPQLICKDAGLAALDRRMAGVYAKAMKAFTGDDLARQRALQRGWIKGRDDCWKARDVRACVDTQYKTRMAELQIGSGQLMAPTPVEYVCDGFAKGKPVTGAFYTGTEPPSVVLTVGDDQVIAFQVPMASGIKYAAQDMEFAEHQGTVTFSWYGNTFSCTVAK